MLENIGAFANNNELDFECDKPIVLIGGMNGRGKTTVLESVLLALYGKRSVNLIGSYQRFDDYLRKISNTTGNRAECAVELSFSVNLEKVDVEYTVRRSWDMQSKHLKMDTRVWKNGNEDNALSESWEMFIEEILPRAVAPFFFFDGEKISELAASENEEQISNSIKSLLGVDVIERLVKDLEVIESRKVKTLNENEYVVELNENEIKILENKQRIKLVNSQLKKVKDDYEFLGRELDALEEKYTIAGGHFAVDKKYIKREYEIVKGNHKNIEMELLDIAAGELPLKMVEELLDDLHDKAELEQEKKEIEILLRRIPEFHKEYVNKVPDNIDIKNFLRYIELKSDKNPILYDLDEEERYKLKNIKKLYNAENKRAQELLAEKRKTEKRIDELENYLLIKIDDDAINILYNKIKEKSAERAIKNDKIKSLEDELSELKIRIESLEKNRVRILEKVVEKLEVADEAKRIIKYVLQQIDILSKYKIELQKLKVDMLSSQMAKCLKRLIAKEGLIDYIHIDPITLEFSYYNSKKQKVNKMILSAGEKQLLVIAMLWALGICAKAKFPLIIDTPLARLDSDHRASVINNYFPYASDQVIILSTDQEITTSDYTMLKEYIGKEYTLQYHEATMSTTVEIGYFGRFDT